MDVSSDLAYVSLAIRALLGWILLTSALGKFWNLPEFRADLQTYPLMTGQNVGWVGYFIPSIELILALNLLVGFYWRLSALGAAVLLGVFTIAVVAQIRRGNSGPCACGGLMPTHSIGRWHLTTNVALLVAAGALAVITETSAAAPTPAEIPMLSQSSSSLDWMGFLTAATTLALLLLVAAASAIWRMRDLRLSLDVAAGMR